MAGTDPWPIDAAAGAPSYGGFDLRLGAVAAFMTGNGAGIGTRSGVRPSGSGTDLLVQAQVSPNMTVRVQPGVVVVQSISAAQGAYTWALDAVKTLNIGAAAASTRIDRILVRIRDANIDTSGARDGDVIVWPGTPGAGVPALPTDASYMEIAQVTVPSTAVNIGGGGGNGTIADLRPFTAAVGGVILCTSATRPNATLVPLGQKIYETDTKRWMFSDGTTWRLTAGQVLYSKKDTSTSFLTGAAAGPFVAVFTSPTITLPNTGTGQAYDVECQIPTGTGAFSAGRFNGRFLYSINGGAFVANPTIGPVAVNASGDTWFLKGMDTYKAGNGDLNVAIRVDAASVGGIFDVIATAANPFFLRVKATGLLSTEVV